MREEQMTRMQSLFIADKTIEELVRLFSCDIENDDDFYDVIAYNIAQADPDYLLEHLPDYQGPRLRGAVFGLGLSPRRNMRQGEALQSLLTHSDPTVAAEAIDALRHAEQTNAWPSVAPLLYHNTPLVKGAVARFARSALPLDQAFALLTGLLRDSDPIVRQSAIDELAILGDQRAVDLIRAYSRDVDEDVRQAALTALNSLSR